MLKKIKPNLHYTHVITPKRATSGGPISMAQRLGNTAAKKRRSGDEPLTTLCLICPSRESNPRSPAPIEMCKTSKLTGRFMYCNIKTKQKSSTRH